MIIWGECIQAEKLQVSNLDPKIIGQPGHFAFHEDGTLPFDHPATLVCRELPFATLKVLEIKF